MSKKLPKKYFSVSVTKNTKKTTSFSFLFKISILVVKIAYLGALRKRLLLLENI